MCLAIPTKIIDINGLHGVVEFGGVRKEIGLHLLPEAKVGEYVLLHAGFAIQKLDEDEADETLKLLEEIIQDTG